MFKKNDKRRLYWLLDQYLTGKITERIFYDEFYYSYDLELDYSTLTELEHHVHIYQSHVANALSVEGKAATFNAAGLSDKTKNNLGISGNTANISAYVVRGEAVNYYQGALGLKAEGRITTLPASYVPRVPGTRVDDQARFVQRVINHTMGVVTKKFNEYNKKK